MGDLTWRQDLGKGIDIDSGQHAWHTGRVNDVLGIVSDGAPWGLLAGADGGNVWALPPGNSAIPLDDGPYCRQVRTLAHGPDGDRHTFAGGGYVPALSAPVLARLYPGRLDAFAVQSGGMLVHTWQTGTGWAPWESLGGELTGTPAVVSAGAGQVDILARGTDGAIWAKSYDGSAWQPSLRGWVSLGGSTRGDPRLVARSDGRIDAFIVGVAGDVMHRFRQSMGAGWEPAAGWVSIGGVVLGLPTAAATGADRVDVVAVGTNGRLFHKALTSSGWQPPATSWTFIEGWDGGDPVLVARTGEIAVFRLGFNGDLMLRSAVVDGAVLSWRTWESTGSDNVSLAAVAAGDALHIISCDPAGGLLHRSVSEAGPSPAEGWHEWGGQCVGTPFALVSESSGEPEVLAAQSDRLIWHRGAGGWERLPPVTQGALRECDATNLLSWRDLELPADVGLVNRVRVDAPSRRLLLATTTGIWWSAIPPKPTQSGSYAWEAATGLPAGEYSDVSLAGDGLVVAGAMGPDLASGRYGLWSGSWTGAANPTLSFMRAVVSGVDVAGFVRIATAFCEGSPRIGYAVATGTNGFLAVVLRSSDGGRTWAPCAGAVNGDARGSTLQQLAGNQGWYNLAIDVAPTSPSTVVFGVRNGPWVSTDSGASFTPKGIGWLGAAWLATTPHQHSDVHGLHFDRTDKTGRRLWMATDGGVLRTDDLGATFSTDDAEALPILQFQRFDNATTAADGGGVLGALQDNGVVFGGPGAPGHGWQQIASGDGIVVCRYAPQRLLFNNNSSLALRLATWTGTALGVVGVIPMSLPASGGGPDKTGLSTVSVASLVRPTAPDPVGDRMFAVGGDQDTYGLFASSSGDLPHWKYLSSTALQIGESIVCYGSYDGSAITIGTNRGRLLVRDAASGFTVPCAVAGLPAGGGVIQAIVAVDATLTMALLNVAGDGYLLRTDPLSGIWRSTPGLPKETIVSLTVDRDVAPVVLYLATESRVYRSDDRGESWQLASSGLPRSANCSALVIERGKPGEERRLHLSTYGRSVFTATVS